VRRFSSSPPVWAEHELVGADCNALLSVRAVHQLSITPGQAPPLLVWDTDRVVGAHDCCCPIHDFVDVGQGWARFRESGRRQEMAAAKWLEDGGGRAAGYVRGGGEGGDGWEGAVSCGML
jgi:hypothetical protein